MSLSMEIVLPITCTSRLQIAIPMLGSVTRMRMALSVHASADDPPTLRAPGPYSTVTDFARLRGLSTSVPRASAV